ncbi:diacylglycerol/lipid kinase family protein [Ornithinibacillus halotolerans]|uniref:Diacylglycerol kinase n=1 Tax=Ornithinibacillus halotolerans TaxID=1274357 RepID=A0A916WAY8_9BACI|nr:diacylglycerol kinase family protein [Ornithinibacillus halotolerans]GGA82601.1 diacylglycerol kinase [Ornithinibacillus halotolerans]
MYIFIVNPVAGNGRGWKVFQKLVKSDLYNDINSQYYVTEYEGHAEEISRRICKENKKIKTVIIIGGDGTVNEVVNGLGSSGIPISFIPGGSGNDFARGCNIDGSPLAILEKIIAGKEGKLYWTGNLTSDSITKTFANSIGIGFDAQIAQRANQSSYKNFFNRLHLGTLSYVLALIHVLFKFKPFNASIEVNGTIRTIHNCWMVTIANHQYYGGGMKIIPTAKIQPEVLPVLIIHDISKWKVLGLFITVFFGKHIGFKEVELFETDKIKLRLEAPMAIQIDGQNSSSQYCEIVKNKQPIQIMGADF